MTTFRRILLSTAALGAMMGVAQAADLPRRAAPPVYAAPPVFTWTGFYAGTLTGYAFTDGSDQTIRTRGTDLGTANAVATGRRPLAVRSDVDGLTSVGGGIGYDYQFNPGSGIVVGVTADGTLMDLDRRRAYIGTGSNLAGAPLAPVISGYRQQLDTLGTVRGRIGYAFDRFLVYGTGGFAFGGVDYRAAFTNAAGAFNYLGRYNDIQTGYAYGGGVEYAIPVDSILNKFNLLSYVGIQSQAVTVKVEYLRYDLGHQSVAVNNVIAPAGAPYVSRFNTEGNLVRGGFTYRFGSLGFAGL